MSDIYSKIIDLLQEYKIPFKEFEHAPILSYEDAEREKANFNWEGVESKNVFMKGGDDQYYVFVTVQGEKVDFKKLKELLNVKMSIATSEDVINVIQCVPGCVCPFGFASEITILIDSKLFTYTDYLFSPGVTTKTIHTNIQEMKIIFENLPNKVITIQ